MRHLKVLAALVGALLIVPLTASAQVEPDNPHGVQCFNNGYNASHKRTVCAVNNTQAPLQDRVEGLIDFNAAPYDTERLNIEVVYIRLWRCDNQVGNPCLKVMDTGNLGWHNDKDGSLSTDWYSACGMGNAKWYHTDIRYRIQWLQVAGDPIGPYVNDHSLSSQEFCFN